MKFKIEYNDEDLDTEELEFFDSKTVTAREWATDHAYARADKGSFKIIEVKNAK